MLHIDSQFKAYCLYTVVALLAAGCASHELARPPRTTEQLLAERTTQDQQFDEELNSLLDRNVARIKADYDRYTAGQATAPPVVNFLVLSGGGDWGAFASGYLVGWGKVPSGPMARPMFDTVTGVSSGALIAPFAFLGDEQSLLDVENIFRNPPADVVKPNGLLNLLTGGESYADTPGLERELRQTLDMSRVQRIAQAGAGGRVLAVNTSNIDTAEMHVWDLVREAQLAVQSGDDGRLHQVLLASAALPGIFPPRLIDGTLYVDGGVTGNVLFTGRRFREAKDTFPARWQAAYPGVPIPRTRYWVIISNELRSPPLQVEPKWSSVLVHSSSASIRSAMLNSIRYLFLTAQYAKLRYNADVEVRMVTIPDGWTAPAGGKFNRVTMTALTELGEKMGADPNSWSMDPP